MSMEGTRESETHDFEKMRAWENAKRGVETAGDPLGRGIDEGVRETVVAFNVSGLPTDSSCEGHFGRGILFPWVGFSAPNKPEERFEGEMNIARSVAEKYGITDEDMLRANNKKAWSEWRMSLVGKRETDAYRNWRKENMKLAKCAESLLAEFYRGHTPSPEMRLVVNDYGSGLRVHAESEYAAYPLPEKDFSQEEKETFLRMQEEARREMRLFTQFLRTAYFER